MVSGLSSAKGEVHNAIDAQLSDVLQAAGSDVLTELQAEVAGLWRPVLQDLDAP